MWHHVAFAIVHIRGFLDSEAHGALLFLFAEGSCGGFVPNILCRCYIVVCRAIVDYMPAPVARDLSDMHLWTKHKKINRV